MWYYLILLWLFISHCSWVHRRGAEYSSFFTVMLWYLCCYQCCKLYTCLKCNRDVPLVFLNTSLKVKIRTLWELQWPRWLAHSLLSLFPAKRARWEKKERKKARKHKHQTWKEAGSSLLAPALPCHCQEWMARSSVYGRAWPDGTEMQTTSPRFSVWGASLVGSHACLPAWDSPTYSPSEKNLLALKLQINEVYGICQHCRSYFCPSFHYEKEIFECYVPRFPLTSSLQNLMLAYFSYPLFLGSAVAASISAINKEIQSNAHHSF